MARKINVKQFRHDIAILKKKGLISGVDARSVKPSPKYTRLINRFEAVISGKATPVLVSKAETKKYKESDYEIVSPRGLPKRVLIPHDATERVYVAGGKVTIKNPAGITRVQIPVAYHDLESYLESIARREKTLNRLKGKNEYWAFKFYGHRSHAVYSSIDLLIDDLQRYESVMNAIDMHNAKQMNEIYHHLEIIKIQRPAAWEQSGKERRGPVKVNDKAKYQRAKKKRAKGPQWQKQQFDAANAARQKEYRARLSDTERAEYKEAAKKRAAKSAKKQKKARRKKTK